MDFKFVPSSRRGRAVRLAVLLGLVIGVTSALAAGSLAAQPKVLVGSAHPILAGQPDQQALLLGQKKVAKFLGWKVAALDAQLSTDKQIAAIDTFTTKKVEGITTFSLDPKASEPAFKRAKTAGIPVVGFNSAAPSVTTVIKQNIFWTCKPGARRCDVHRRAETGREGACHGRRRGARAALTSSTASSAAAKKAGLTCSTGRTT